MSSVVPFGSTYGVLPGSQLAGINAGYGPMYQGIGTMMAPNDNSAFLNLMQGKNLEQDMGIKQQKWDFLKNLLGSNIQGTGSGSYHYTAPNVPAPNYISAGPVWAQQQINSQANLQRGNLLTQANNQNRMFTQGLASRGFSPMSPFAMQNAQSNIMRANAGAAANETNLNWTAAQANSDAALKAAGINAGLYGDYTRNLMGQAQAENQYNLQSRGLSQDFIGMLMKGLA